MVASFFNNTSLGQPRPQTQPAPTVAAANAGGQSADLQAQWAEYYKQLGYYYGQQQTQQPPAAAGGPPPEQKVYNSLSVSPVS